MVAAGDKWQTFLKAKQLNLPVPPSQLCGTAADAIQLVSREFEYPIVLKRLNGHAGLAVQLCRNADEIKRFYARHGDRPNPWKTLCRWRERLRGRYFHRRWLPDNSHILASRYIPGRPAMVRVGPIAIASADARGLPPVEIKALKAGIEARIKDGLKQAGYPAKADPKRMNLAGAFGVLLVFVIAATALFGPIAACLVELFPTRIRYTALSLPYHIGTGWVGGFVPFTAFAIVASVGNIYSGLWYPFAFTAISVLVTALLLPETRHRSLDS